MVCQERKRNGGIVEICGRVFVEIFKILLKKLKKRKIEIVRNVREKIKHDRSTNRLKTL